MRLRGLQTFTQTVGLQAECGVLETVGVVKKPSWRLPPVSSFGGQLDPQQP